jgi:MoxR-like ATPase
LPLSASTDSIGSSRSILAALVTEDPLLLIGASGTGKTYLLNSLSEALGLEHRHYNASLISFDDLVGFPYPGPGQRRREVPRDAGHGVGRRVGADRRDQPLQARAPEPPVLAGARARVQGIALPRLRYRWAAMNPCSGRPGRQRGLCRIGAP